MTTVSSAALPPLLTVDNLSKHFPIGKRLFGKERSIRAVDGVGFSIGRGETLSLVGESGCGKSTTGRIVGRLLTATSGRITFEGQDITGLDGAALRALRRDIQMVFQDPYSSLNPRQTIGDIIEAPFAIQNIEPSGGRRKAVLDLMARVGLNPEHVHRYPREFSGGQRQRIGIARALALSPKLIICDEPVSALDVSVQAQVINLLQDLQRDLGLSYLFIAHDLSVVRHISRRVAVMYLGRIVEIGDAETVYANPRHPYTQALMASAPLPDPDRAAARPRVALKGELPSPMNPPRGCAFHTRCPIAQDRCRSEAPLLLPSGGGASTACHFAVSPAIA
jgi:oligopeptide/dipeptide ABC transporter ATP-binding protein